jgi:Kdo2-lipid IVA lauroyltransferase/acyltransferase
MSDPAALDVAPAWAERAPRRHKRPRSRARSWAEHQGIVAVLAWLRSQPLEAASRRMAAILGLAYYTAPRLRRVGLENLRHAFPERDDVWCAATLRESLRNLGRMAAEVARFHELSPGNIRERVGFMTEEDALLWRERTAGKGGAIIATGHFGNWELFAQAAGLMGAPIHIVHRPLRNPLLDDLLNEVRSRAGTGVIYKHAAAREILRLLRRGTLVAIPIDQHAPGAQGVPMPFFGRPAATTLGPARLAQLTRSPLQTAVLVRRGTTNQHDIHLRPPIDPPPPGKDPGLLAATMAIVNQEFESMVRAWPAQWLWVHRRWRPA